MLTIKNLSVECLTEEIVTDNCNPRITYIVDSDKNDVHIVQHRCIVYYQNHMVWDSGLVDFNDSQSFQYQGEPLLPFSNYLVTVETLDNYRERATGEIRFKTGRLDTPWQAKWITDPTYQWLVFSPKPMVFRKKIALSKEIKSAKLYATAFGVYELDLNGKKVGEDYFAPGFTSYEKQMQYQTYNITDTLERDNTLVATVAGGWAVGDYTMMHRHRIYANRQALLLEVRINYKDGTSDILGTDSTWEVSEKGNWKYADFYMGEVYDARIDVDKIKYKKASVTTPRLSPKIFAQYGMPVRRHEALTPIRQWKSKTGAILYDFGQNFSGVISMTLKGVAGQKITVKHAEICMNDELYTKPLRLAKARIVYTCKAGRQQYTPRFTYMGFRYVSVDGIDSENIEMNAYTLYSDIPATGYFACSNNDINKLQSNIIWGGKSNFVDIPTDCPQRDERMGWTGDIAVFANTAAFNFDMRRFLDKWLLDVIAEQGDDGGIPDVVPRAKYGKPRTTSCWADSCVLVPWAAYLAYGDKTLLERQYHSMKKHVEAELRMAADGSGGDEAERYIWRKGFQYGDWCAPGEVKKQWEEKTPWVATAFMANSCKLLSKIACELGKKSDAEHYDELSRKIDSAYLEVHTDTAAKLHHEFQTGYVLPLYFNMVSGKTRKEMAGHLAALVKKADNHLATGFCGTPYLLFSLSDNGYLDVAYDLLLQDTCPSWLYEVKTGGTTVWERWDALRPDGTVNQSNNMVSFNHYAYGAVGDWLYRRVAGIEPVMPGYREFTIKPMPGGGLSWVKTSLQTVYGEIVCNWEITDCFQMHIKVPANTKCTVVMPDGSEKQLGSGSYNLSCSYDAEAIS